MEANYAVINGERVELSDEQCRALGIDPIHSCAEMFERKKDGTYFYTNGFGDIQLDRDDLYCTDKDRHDAANYCRDKNIMQQRALHEVLNRLLWRASLIAGEADNPWDGHTKHYYIYFGTFEGVYKINYNDNNNGNNVYFPTREDAEKAIIEIIKPFLKDHPEFKW